MKNFFFFSSFLFLFVNTNGQEKQIQVSSKITNVTVFLKGAQVQRRAESIEVPQGVTAFVFSGLSPTIESQSIQAKGEGNFTILSVVQQRNFLADKKNSEEKTGYLNSITALNDQISVLRNESEVYKQDEEMLLKNNTIMGPNVNYDLVKLKQAMDFQKLRLAEAKGKQVEISKSIGKLQEQVNSYLKQLTEISGKTIGNTNEIVVKISSPTATKGKLVLTYLINDAGWYPTYDIRAKDVSNPIELVYKANVSQNSGEDWKNIKLTLSSGNPSINSVKPELPTYNLGFLSSGYAVFDAQNYQSRSVKGKVFDSGDRSVLPGVSVRIKNSSVATSTDAAGRFTLQVPNGATALTFSSIGYQTTDLPISYGEMNVALSQDQNSLNEVAVVEYSRALQGKSAGVNVSRDKSKASVAVQVDAVEMQTNVVFEIKNPYTILSDGKQFSVDIGNFDFKADYEYYSVPKVSEDAFLTAKISDFGSVNLLSGEANVFFEGTFLGKTLIDPQSAADTLTISLGTDKNVIVKRERQKDFNEKQFIGSSQRDSRSYIIDIKNRKTQAINLIIEDQIPISSSSDITVDRQEISQAKYSDDNGKLKWQLFLQPNEQKKLTLKYQVKYPKNKPINLE